MGDLLARHALAEVLASLGVPLEDQYPLADGRTKCGFCHD